jgi:hypothetical protein
MEKLQGTIKFVCVCSLLIFLVQVAGKFVKTPEKTSENQVTEAQVTETSNDEMSQSEISADKDMSVWSPEYLAYYINNMQMDLYNFKSEEEQINKRSSRITPEQCYLKTSEGFFNSSEITYKKADKETDYIYMGEIKKDYPDGYGIIFKLINVGGEFEPKLVKQMVYDGMFKQGKFSGFGKGFYFFSDDENEWGRFKSIIYNSEDPQSFLDEYFNEVEYIGYYKDGLYDGKGIQIIYPNKLRTSQFQARRTMKADEDPEYYSISITSGQFEKGYTDGKTKLYYKGFLLYDGQTKKGVMHGQGKEYYIGSDHLKYEGNYKFGEKSGKGTLYNFDGEVVCSGEWKNNLCGLINAEDFQSPFETTWMNDEADEDERKEVTATETIPNETKNDLAESQEETVPESKNANVESGYILPDSNERYLTADDIRGLSKEELRLARNEIYARHGRIFESEDLKEYFSKQSWYSGHILSNEFDEGLLNAYEKVNLEVIVNAENSDTETSTQRELVSGLYRDDSENYAADFSVSVYTSAEEINGYLPVAAVEETTNGDSVIEEIIMDSSGNYYLSSQGTGYPIADVTILDNGDLSVFYGRMYRTFKLIRTYPAS